MRDATGDVDRIFETKHPEGLTPEELAVREINLGTYVFDAKTLFEALDQVELVQGERYLTGVFPLIRAEGRHHRCAHDRRRRRRPRASTTARG